jgi:hypothetical protein
MSTERPVLLTEMLASVPSYMRISPEDLSDIFKSFWNIFKSMWSSLKLLDSLLMLNLRVIGASWKGDKAAIAEAFKIFKGAREKFDKESYENLEYFRKAYSDPSLSNLGGFGPKVLAFAANPLMFISFEKSKNGEKDSYASDSDGSSSSASKEKTKKRVTTPRLGAALSFFGYEGSSLNEAAAPSPAQSFSKEDTQNAKKLQSVAQQFVDQEQKHAEEILRTVGGRPAAIKKIAESKSFDELISALSFAKSSGMKVSDADVKKAQASVQQSLSKKQKEAPDEFKKAVKDMRKKAPDIKEPDDLKAMVQFTFGLVKSQIQQQLVSSYNDVFKTSMAAMNLPLDPEVEKNLQKTEIGESYLKVLKNFQSQLESGAAAVKSIKSV